MTSTTWPTALASLDDSLARIDESLAELNAAKAVDVSRVAEQLKLAAESARTVQSLIASELPKAKWQSREELDALLGGEEKRCGLLSKLRHRLSLV